MAHMHCREIRYGATSTDLGEVGREAVVGPGLYSQAYAPRPALLTEPHCFCDIAGRVARERIMQVAHEVISIVQRQRHECAAH